MKHTIDLGALLLITFAIYTAICWIVDSVIENVKKRKYNRQIEQLKREKREMQHTAEYAEFIAISTAYGKDN